MEKEKVSRRESSPNPPSLIQVYKKVRRKSRAGVSYDHYVPEIVGKPRVGTNRAQRRHIKKEERRFKSEFKKRVLARIHDMAQEAKRKKIAERFPQREFLCKTRKCTRRNRSKGLCTVCFKQKYGTNTTSVKRTTSIG